MPLAADTASLTIRTKFTIGEIANARRCWTSPEIGDHLVFVHAGSLRFAQLLLEHGLFGSGRLDDAELVCHV